MRIVISIGYDEFLLPEGTSGKYAGMIAELLHGSPVLHYKYDAGKTTYEVSGVNKDVSIKFIDFSNIIFPEDNQSDGGE